MATLLALARVHEVFPGDRWALLELSRWRSGQLTLAVSVIYLAGWGNYLLPYLPIGITAFAAVYGRWSDGLLLAACGILPPVLNLALKELTARPRPVPSLALVQEMGYAFPSGHTVFVAAFYGALIYLLSHWGVFPARPMLRWVIQGMLTLFILAVAASRVYLGAHWPSDVIGGLLLGGLCLAALAAGHRAIQARQ